MRPKSTLHLSFGDPCRLSNYLGIYKSKGVDRVNHYEHTHFSTVMAHVDVARMVLRRRPRLPTTIPTTRFSLGMSRITVMSCWQTGKTKPPKKLRIIQIVRESREVWKTKTTNYISKNLTGGRSPYTIQYKTIQVSPRYR